MDKLDPALLADIVKRIRNAIHPLRIILFGSAARGGMTEDSDLDILIIVPDGTHRRRASREAFRALRGIGTAKDIIVVTDKDVANYSDNPSLILKPALEEGMELYAKG